MKHIRDPTSGSPDARTRVAIGTSAILAGLALLASGVVADNVVNDVTADLSTRSFTAGGSITVSYRIQATPVAQDGQAGCNAAEGSAALVSIHAPSGVTATPSSLTFTACSVPGNQNAQSVVFSSSTPGSYSITASVSDSGVGTYSTTGAAFTLVVNATTPSDTTPPAITPNVSPPANGAGWHNEDVTVTWTVTDEESAVASTSGCGSTTISTDTTASGTTLTCEATSAGGTSSASVTIKRDTVLPTVDVVGGPADGAAYDFGAVPAAPSCSASDALSGLAGACSVSGYSSAVGSHTIIASATDVADNTGTAQVSYTVSAWDVRGLYHPVDMGGVLNAVKSGATVPLKFEIFTANAGTEITSTSSVQSLGAKRISCTTSAVEDTIELVATGGTSLRYDATGGQFVYNWQTPKQPGACYQVTVTTLDGSAMTALFRLK